MTARFKPPKVAPDPEYLHAVRCCDCCACGRYQPSEAHHCKDVPPYDEQGLYTRLPGMGMRSGDRDAIPLCARCHRMYHLNKPKFHEKYGPDYGFIGVTRAELADMELDF